MDKTLEILDLADDVRTLVGECELTGRRTIFARSGHAVAILTSYDEYLALRETIAIANDAPLRASIAAGEEEVAKGAMLLVEDFLLPG